MSKDKQDQSVFDVAKIRELIELMQEHELREVDLQQAEKRIRLKRGAEGAPVVSYAAPPAPAPTATPSAAPGAAPSDSAPAADDNAIYIKSPTIGTFYSRPKPDADDFVKVGVSSLLTPSSVWSKR